MSDDGKSPTSLQPWRVLSSRVTYEDRWLKLRSDECVTAEGVVVSPYHVVEYRDFVAIVALTRDLELVTLREYRHGRAMVVDGIPGGVIDEEDGAEDAAEICARRELLEETGYGGGRFIPILTVYPDPANHSNVATAFLALGVEPTGGQSLDTSEALEVVLDQLPRVLARLRDGSMRMHAVHVAALWTAAARIAAGDEAVIEAVTLRDRLVSVLAGR